jgi:hypothetical protein
MGFGRVFRAYYQAADLRRPSMYKHTDIDTWCDTINGVAELRNLIVHGAPCVSSELSEFSKRPTSMSFDFVEGAPLIVRLHHMQSIECFADQLLTALNISLLEKAIGPLPSHETRRTEGRPNR